MPLLQGSHITTGHAPVLWPQPWEPRVHWGMCPDGNRTVTSCSATEPFQPGYHILFTCSPVGGHLSCLHLLAVVSNAAISVGEQVLVSVLAFGSSECLPRRGIAMTTPCFTSWGTVPGPFLPTWAPPRKHRIQGPCFIRPHMANPKVVFGVRQSGFKRQLPFSYLTMVCSPRGCRQRVRH